MPRLPGDAPTARPARARWPRPPSAGPCPSRPGWRWACPAPAGRPDPRRRRPARRRAGTSRPPPAIPPAPARPPGDRSSGRRRDRPSPRSNSSRATAMARAKSPRGRGWMNRSHSPAVRWWTGSISTSSAPRARAWRSTGRVWGLETCTFFPHSRMWRGVQQVEQVVRVLDAEVERLGGVARARADVAALDGDRTEALEEVVGEVLEDPQRAARAVVEDGRRTRLAPDGQQPLGDEVQRLVPARRLQARPAALRSSGVVSRSGPYCSGRKWLVR